MSLVLLSITVFGMTGESVYKAKCASCHAMKAKMEKSGMLAPAMPMVSMRLKKMTGTKDKFIVFVKDYIQNPSQDKGFCMPMAYKRFGTMPAIGKGMTEKERTVVANWLYDNFKGKWGASKDAKACDSRNSKKCGSKSKKGSMKCGAGKCGAVKIPTH